MAVLIGGLGSSAFAEHRPADTTGGATAAIASSGVVDFVRGGEMSLWWRGYNGNAWTPWQSLGGYLTSDPVALFQGSAVSVFVRGGDMGIWTRTFNGTSWTD